MYLYRERGPIGCIGGCLMVPIMSNTVSSVANKRIEREQSFHDVRFTENPGRRWSLSSMMGDIKAAIDRPIGART